VLVRLIIVLTLLFVPGNVVNADEGLAFFESQVRPILVRRCEKCHGAKKQEGGPRLDQRSGWARGGDRGLAVVPGKPAASLLVKAVRYTDPDLQMPPGGKLPEPEIKALAEWVGRGAVDPRDGAAIRLGGMTLREAKSFWSLQPVRRPPVPVASPRWVRSGSPADAFLSARLGSTRRG
jgi:hypothetical protein